MKVIVIGVSYNVLRELCCIVVLLVDRAYGVGLYGENIRERLICV